MNLIPPLFSVLPRSRASAMLLAAALVMASVATTLVAAVPLYSGAIVEAGLRSTLLDAAPTESGFEAAFRVDVADLDEIGQRLATLADDRLPGRRDQVLLARSDTYQFEDEDAGDGWITTFGSIDGSLLDDVTTVRPVTPGVVGARLHRDAAEFLGLTVGDQVRMARPGAPPVDVQIVALVAPVDPFDKLWWDTPVFRDGVTRNGSFTEIGPFFVDGATLASFGGTVNVRWRFVPDPDSISTGDIAELRRGVAGFETAIADEVAPTSLAAETDLPGLLAATDTAIGSTGAVIAAVLLQLVGVALYGVGLAATVLAGSRTVETAMLRSRGATAEQLGTMAAVESLMIAVPAVLIGPLLGVRVVGLVERWGPIAQTDLELRPDLDVAAWLAALVVGVAIAAIVTWPAVRSARGFAAVQASRSRPEGPTALQRSGLDVLVAALALLALWRLSGSSAATRDLEGRLGTDPVLVFAPALGVVAASVLTLRLIGVASGLAQRVTARQGPIALALAGWELARRPGRTARTSVLIVLSVTVGTFAAVHGESWRSSLVDQADAEVSADAVVAPDLRPSAEIGPPYLADAYRNLDQVHALVPVGHDVAAISRDLSAVPVVLTDTEALDDVLRLRSDLYGDLDGANAFAALHRPTDLGGVAIGAADDDLTLDFGLDVRGDGASGALRITATLIDGDGTPVIVASTPVTLDRTTGTVTFPLGAEDIAGHELRLSGDLQLVRLEVEFPSVQDDPFNDDPLPGVRYELTLTAARVGDRTVSLGTDWAITQARLGSVLSAPDAALRLGGGSVVVVADSGSTEQAAEALDVTIDTPGLAAGATARIPAFVTPALLDAASLRVGDRLTARFGGTSAELVIEGVVPVVPFAVREPLALIADWETVSIDRFVHAGRIAVPDTWAFVTDEPGGFELSRVLSGAPYHSERFADRWQEARAIGRQPVTVGLSGSLALALVASLIIATIGLVLTAVVGGRERRPAFAVLRAMGTRASELRRWLVLETVPLIGISALAGLASGIALARLALPSLGLGRDGTRAVPDPRLVVPWPTLALIVAVAVAAGMALPVVTARLLRRHRTADELRIGDTT